MKSIINHILLPAVKKIFKFVLIYSTFQPSMQRLEVKKLTPMRKILGGLDFGSSPFPLCRLKQSIFFLRFSTG